MRRSRRMQPDITIAEHEPASAEKAIMESISAQESSRKVSSMQRSKEESPDKKKQRKKLVKEVKVSSTPLCVCWINSLGLHPV